MVVGVVGPDAQGQRSLCPKMLTYLLAAVATVSIAATLSSCADQPPPSPQQEAETIERTTKVAARLQYVSGDYREAVANGAIIDPREFAEQRKLVSEALDLAGGLVSGNSEFEALLAMVSAAEPVEQVSDEANRLASRFLIDNGVIVAPLDLSSRERARSLFRENCVKCHGESGGGDGAEAAELEIKPRSFQNSAVMDAMSPARVFGTLTHGIADSKMPTFDLLTPADRWALANFVFSLRFVGASGGAAGQAPTKLPALLELSESTDAELLAALDGDEQARVFARTALPFEGAPALAPRLGSIRSALANSISLHRSGRRVEAQAPINAILTENLAALRPGLLLRDGGAVRSVLAKLHELRSAIPTEASLTLEQRALHVSADLALLESASRQSPPIALAAAATLAALGWLVVLLFVGNETARAVGVYRATTAIHIGWGLAAITGVASFMLTTSPTELASPSGRFQAVAGLKLFAVGAALVCAAISARRLAAPMIGSSSSAAIPWWLTAITFAVTYGGALEAASHLGWLALILDQSKFILLIGAIGSLFAVACVSRLVVEVLRRAGDGATLAVVSATSVITAVALTGLAIRSLIDGGVLAGTVKGVKSIASLGVLPYRFTAIGQVVVSVLATAVLGYIWLSRRRDE